jgi:hypothetical protein
MDLISGAIAGLSLLLSIYTLYLTNLRGPNIHLATPGKIYPVHGVVKGEAVSQLFLGDPLAKNNARIQCRLIVANTGAGAGVLHWFRIDNADDIVASYHLDPMPEQTLPTSLLPGAGWTATLSIDLKPGPWQTAPHSKSTLQMQAVVIADRPFGQRKEETIPLPINLADAYPSL